MFVISGFNCSGSVTLRAWWARKFPNSDRVRLKISGVKSLANDKRWAEKMDKMIMHKEMIAALIEALKEKNLTDEVIVRIILKMTKKSG